MMKRAYLFLMLLFGFTVANVYAASDANELANLLNAVQSMKADFKQTVYDNHGKAIQQSVGRMAMQRPGKFRWEVLKPIPQTIVANTSRLWIYDPDLEQVTIRVLKKAAGETPALLLSHVDSVLTEAYTVTYLPKKSNELRWFNLAPKNADNVFAAIQMGFLNGQINQMKLQDHLGHDTVIRFERIKTNITLPASLFNFKVPRNVDVIDETKRR